MPDPQPTGRPPAAALPIRRLFLVLGLAATGYALALAWASGGVSALVFQQLRQSVFSGAGLVAAALCMVSYALRGWRWRLWMADAGRPLKPAEGLRLYIAGYALTPTPGNVGEAARGLWLVNQPLSTSASLAIFAAERLADLLGLVLMALPAALWLGFKLLSPAPAAWGAHGGRFALLAVIALVALVVTVALLGSLSKVLQRWQLWRHVQARLLTPAWKSLAHRPASWLALTLLAWTAQGLAVAMLCSQAGLDLATWLAAGSYAIAMVGGALSALPAGLGGTEVLLAALLGAQGASGSAAVAVTVLVRLLTLWLAVGLGLASLFYSAALRRDIRLG
jgi:uncharacterized membrane protein YbhN (UPF0104 family)